MRERDYETRAEAAAKPNGVDRRLEITARKLCDVVATPTKVRWLSGLRKILERGVIAVIAGPRGAHKSTVVWHWALQAAAAGEVVVIISPEGSGHDRRALAYMKLHGAGRDIDEFTVYLIERRIDLNSQEGIAALLEEIQRLGIHPSLIVVDTLSKNAGALDTDNNPEVAAYIGRIDLQIRCVFDATVLIVTHTGHADRSRPRGASALEADTDSAYVVQKSDGLVTVSRERFKDSAELEPLSYSVQVVDLDRVDDDGEAVTSCALLVTDTVPATTRPELKGKAQRQLLAALRARTNGDAGKIWTPEELRRVARESGLSKATARSAAEAVSLSPYMIPSVGGYRVAD